MTNTDKTVELKTVYHAIFNEQKFEATELNYTFFEEQRGILNTLAEVGNSGVSIFDCYKRKHIFYSLNFGKLLGYDKMTIEQEGLGFMENKTHPDDLNILLESSIYSMKLFYSFSSDERCKYKFISEFRMKNSFGKYINVIEQHQVYKLDSLGNIWLALSVIDVSPNQNEMEVAKCKMFNFHTGNFIPLPILKMGNLQNMTRREKEILQLVKDGLLSKEISDLLYISVHTVNTHRQKVLEKLGVNNSIEAINLASKLGLLD